jgi:16S rRNA (uracil1498-N3)-methyltransferase
MTFSLLSARSHVLLADQPGEDLLLTQPSSIVLPQPVLHHLRRVLRLRAGELVTVTNGRGSWVPTVVPVGDQQNSFEVVGPVFHCDPRASMLCVGFALTKGDKPDLTVQKLTECGIDRIVLLEASRNVARWDAQRAAKHLTKLRLVAAEALMQSRGVWMPTISGPISVASFCDQLKAAGEAVFRADMDAPPMHDAVTTIVIGPEGGWDPSERAQMPNAVSFAGTVLRAETAAIVAAGILSSRRHAKSTHSAW